METSKGRGAENTHTTGQEGGAGCANGGAFFVRAQSLTRPDVWSIFPGMAGRVKGLVAVRANSSNVAALAAKYGGIATEKQFAAFTAALSRGAKLSEAASMAGVPWPAIANHIRTLAPPDQAKWWAAVEASTKFRALLAVDKCFELGVEGVDGEVNVKRGHAWRYYKDRELVAKIGTPALQGGKVELSGPGGGAIAIGALVIGPMPPASLAEWSEVYREQRRKAGRGPMAAGAAAQAKPVRVAVDTPAALPGKSKRRIKAA